MGLNKLQQTAPVPPADDGDGKEAPSKKQQKAQKKAEKRSAAPDSKLKRR